MKVHEAAGMDWTSNMSYDERKDEFSRYREEVEGMLGYELTPLDNGSDGKRPTPHPQIDELRKAFLKGLEADEAAELLQGNNEPERFRNELSDEDLANMGEFDSANGEDDEDNYEIDPNDDFVDPRDEEDDHTDQSMRQGEMGFPGRRG